MFSERLKRIMSGWGRHLSALGAFVLLRRPTQNRSRFGGVQDRVYKCLGVTRAQDQHRSLLNSPLRRSFGAMKDEISHSSAFQIRGPLNQDLLVLIQASVEAISLPLRGFPFAFGVCRSSTTHAQPTSNI